MAQPVTIPLYPGAVPGAIASNFKEYSILVNGTRRVYHVTQPTLTLFRPAMPNGKAMIICPGGAYSRLSIDNEGELVAMELIKAGITAFVLKYRLPNDTIMIDKTVGALQDVQQAIRYVRSHAAKWQVNANQIGVMGFSAGGHLAAMALVHADADINTTKDTVSARPNFAALIYPVISMMPGLTHRQSQLNLLGGAPTERQLRFFSAELNVSAACPPMFLVHAKDDPAVPYQNSVAIYEACLAQKVPASILLYPAGGHGFGLHNASSNEAWLDQLLGWLMQW